MEDENVHYKILVAIHDALVPVDLSVKIIQNTTNDCKALRLSLLKPKVQSYRLDCLPNQALSVPEIKR